MNLLITKNGIVIYEGKVETNLEAHILLRSLLQLLVEKRGNSYVITQAGVPLNPSYSINWEPSDILYDALKCGYLNRLAGNYRFYKIEPL